jgi:hypothetical protein
MKKKIKIVTMITEKELKAIAELDANDRYKYSIKRIADYENLWVLGDSEGLITYSDSQARLIFPIWPFKEFALLCRKDDFSGSEPEEITLDSFMDDYLPEFMKKKYMLSVLPLTSDRGSVVEIDTFINDLKNELKNY